LESRVPSLEWRELQRVVDALEEDVPRRAYALLEGAYLESVERHEVQHRLDYDQEDRSLPARLEELAGPLEVHDIENTRAKSANAEFSAYLAELARGPEVVKTNLALLSRFLFDRSHWGRAESYSALVIFEAMAHELGVEPESMLEGGSIQRDAVARSYLAMRANPASELSRAAAAAWQGAYGRSLPPLVRVSP